MTWEELKIWLMHFLFIILGALSIILGLQYHFKFW